MSRITAGLDRRSPHGSLAALVISLVVSIGAALGFAAPARAVPPLSQLPGLAGCYNLSGSGPCTSGVLGLDGAGGVAVSPDGRNVYVTALFGNAVVVFDVDPETGALTQKAGTDGCVSESGLGCENGKGLNQAQGIAMSPDGRNVYVASVVSSAVAVFDRDVSTGALQQKATLDGCISKDGSSAECGINAALDGAIAVVVSPDGRNVYVAASTSDFLVKFDRDFGSGVLSNPQNYGGGPGDTDGINGLAFSPDGRNLYVAARDANAVGTFSRAATGELGQANDHCWNEDGSGDCEDGRALQAPRAVVVSSDGRNVYVASQDSNGIAIFDRDPDSGQLTQKAGTAGCITGDGGDCATGIALTTVFAIAASDDGESVYVGAPGSNAVAVFDRDLTTGELAQKAGTAGCVSSATGGCATGRGLGSAAGVAVRPGSHTVYVAAFLSDTVSVFDRDAPSYDIDGDGESDALTDGLLLLRYFFGFRGDTLITGAVDLVNCTRCTAPDIESYIESLRGF